jgi:hypothetical protein
MITYPSIEKNVPIPPRAYTAERCRSARLRVQFLKQMEIGDSFKVEDEKARQLWIAHAKYYGVNLVTRKLDGEGIRIWKVK